jgi:hypothetical protein
MGVERAEQAAAEISPGLAAGVFHLTVVNLPDNARVICLFVTSAPATLSAGGFLFTGAFYLSDPSRRQTAGVRAPEPSGGGGLGN